MDNNLLATINGLTGYEDLLKKYENLSAYECETVPRFKSILDGETLGTEMYDRWDACNENETITLNEGMYTECKITNNGNGTYHCESEYLGNFDYNPDNFAIGYKEVPDALEGENKIPILKCTALEYDGYETGDMQKRKARVHDFAPQEISIPEGAKNIDYTFEGMDNLNFIPRIPDSVESAHCAFKDCENLWQESTNALTEWHVTHNAMKLPENLQDMSGMFYGCSNLNDLSFDKLPKNVLTIDGAFADCEKLFTGREASFLLGIIKWTAHDGSDKFSYKGCDHLTDYFANPTNAATSNQFKLKADKAKEKLQENRKVIESTIDSQPEEEQEAYKDTVAAESVHRGKRVENGESLAGSPEETGIDVKENKFGENIQSIVMSALGGIGIKLIVGDITGSGVLGTIAGIGGGLLLNSSGLLNNMLEPVVAFAEDMTPEGSTKDMLDKFKNTIHVPSNEERNIANEQRFADWAQTGLKNVYGGMLKAPVDNLDECMYNSAQDLVKYRSYYYASEEGESGPSFKNLNKLSKAAVDKVEGKASLEEKNEYYTKIINGLIASNQGATDAVNEMYQEDSYEKEQTLTGISMANKASATPIVEAMIKDGLLTEENKELISKIPGVNLNEIEESMQRQTSAISLSTSRKVSQNTTDASERNGTATPQQSSQAQAKPTKNNETREPELGDS